MGVWTGLIGQHNGRADTNIQVAGIQFVLIVGHEKIAELDSRTSAKPQHRLAVTASWGIGSPVAYSQEQIALIVRRNSAPAHPDAAAPAVWGAAIHTHLPADVGGSIAHHPSVIVAHIAVCGPYDIDNPI